MHTLYISYFGALKHLTQTQVVPYLQGLAQDGLQVTLMTFEGRLPDRAEEKRRRSEMAEQLRSMNIAWIPLRYHKRPSLPATVFDVLVGAVVAAWLVLRRKVDVVHVRSHVPAPIGLLMKALFGTKLVFDVRGLLAEEYVDAGTWKMGGLPYRITKAVERAAFRRADAVIVLTRRIQHWLLENSGELKASGAPIHVVPCCADVETFERADRAGMRRRLGLEDKLVLAYVGSLGGWYMDAEMAAFFAEMRGAFPHAHFLVLTQSPNAIFAEHLKAQGLPPDSYTIRTVGAWEVPEYLAAADCALSFIKPCFSKLSSSPTKIGEYLAAGLPLVCNAGIGDQDELLERERVGVMVQEFSAAAYAGAILALRPMVGNAAVQQRCRGVARRWFSLAEVGQPGYRRVYEGLGWVPERAAVPARSGR